MDNVTGKKFNLLFSNNFATLIFFLALLDGLDSLNDATPCGDENPYLVLSSLKFLFLFLQLQGRSAVVWGLESKEGSI